MSPGIVDPGDVLRYTIRIYNNGTLPITQRRAARLGAREHDVRRRLDDAERPARRPARRRRVAARRGRRRELVEPDAAAAGRRRGHAVGRRDGRRAIRSARERRRAARHGDREPGHRRRRRSCRTCSTDGDGNPATGPEPTVVVVGNLQELRITKNVAVVGGGPAIAGATLEYVVQVTNIGTVPAYARRDPRRHRGADARLSHVRGSGRETLNGSTNGITVAGSLLTADYSTTYGALQPGRTIMLRFRAVLNPNLAIGTRVTNTGDGLLERPDADRRARASRSTSAASRASAFVNGTRLARRGLRRRLLDANERQLEGWTVELYLNDTLAHIARTDADGVYRIERRRAELRDRRNATSCASARPAPVRTTAMLGRAHSDLHERSAAHHGHRRACRAAICRTSICRSTPNGVVYDSYRAPPIAGATLTLLDRGERRGAAVELLLRPGPARPGHARRRLLQVRSELRRSGVPERRRLSCIR